MPDKEEKTVDIDTSGPGADVELPEEKVTETVETVEPEKQVEEKRQRSMSGALKRIHDKYNAPLDIHLATDDFNEFNTDIENITRAIKGHQSLISMPSMSEIDALGDADRHLLRRTFFWAGTCAILDVQCRESS